MYCATIKGIAREEGNLNALEDALPGFKQYGVDANIKNSTASDVTLEVYVSVAARPRRFSPPPITRQTADAYNLLIQKVIESGYAEIKELRDGRTGLGNPNGCPLFEVI